MSERKTLIRKLIYGALIVVLWVPLSWLSQPATKESPGGTLAKLRQEHKLSQAELGDIDPSSATMKLATMGLGGVAVNLLWDRANEYKKKEDWIALGATLEQIVKLQPNFYKVWDYQAHNLSYNLSAEFDDYHDRYTYVIRGVNFLKQGVEKNENEPRLLHRVGWYLGQKLGRADEHVQYRQLFREDWSNLFHARDNPNRFGEERDNWLVSREYFRKAESLADRLETLNIPLKTTPLLFYSEAPKSQINYAEMRQIEGRFLSPQDRADTKQAWETALREWAGQGPLASGGTLPFGRRPFTTTFGVRMRLEDQESQEDLAAELSHQLEAMLPGVRDSLREEKLKQLPPDAREAIRTPEEDRTLDQRTLAAEHEYKVAVGWDEVADRAPAESRAEAKRLANALNGAMAQVDAIMTDRMTVNYEYWRVRGLAEPEEDTLEARRLTYEANKLVGEVEIFKAVPVYEEAWKKWRQVIDRYPRMAGESVSADELVEDINTYHRTLDKLGRKFPQPFILQDVIDIASQKIVFSPEELAKKDREARAKAIQEGKAKDTSPSNEQKDTKQDEQ